MNRRQQEAIEVRVARVGGELGDLLDKVRKIIPEEYDSLLEHAKVMTDECRRIRRAVEDKMREGGR